MSSGIREQIMQALAAAFTASEIFTTVTRVNRASESFNLSNTPALVLRSVMDVYKNPAPSQPIQTFYVSGLIYIVTDVSNPNLIPDQPMNDVIDKCVAFFAPDNLAEGRFTLGGLVYVAEIDGNGKRAQDDKNGRSAAILPIKIVLP